MRLNFKKITAIAASTLMVGLTMGTAIAANYPQPFVVGGSANVAIVYGTGSGVSALDVVQAGNIQSNLQSYMASSEGGTSVTGGDYWQIGTTSDKLEINESINDIVSYISQDEFGLLASGTLSNEKGDSNYKQYLYFPDTYGTTPLSGVVYTADPDTDELGLFYEISGDEVIARYVMEFTTSLKSDIDTADNKLSDIQDKEITFLGKTYTFTSAYMTSTGVQLTLMSGALSGTVTEGNPMTVDGYTVDVTVSSSSAAQFTITSSSGTETTSKMAEGDITKLADGQYLAVTDITYEGYADGDQSATFYIGADKLEWFNNSAMTVNGNTISSAHVDITASNVSDVSISSISINMTAEDDLYVPMGSMLSEASDLDEPEVLVSQNWDIQFAGLANTDYETIDLKATGSDKKYVLEFMNYDGDLVQLPLVWANATGVFGGDTADKDLIMDADDGWQNISKNDYFILNSADPTSSTTNAKTVVVQYKGADKTSDNDPKFHFVVNPGPNQQDADVDMSTTGSGTLTGFAGASFTFVNGSDCSASTNCNIRFTSGSYGEGGGVNHSVSNYIRTYYNTLINITDQNATSQAFVYKDTQDAVDAFASLWTVAAYIDDATRDDDSFTLPANGALFNCTFGNTTSDMSMNLSGTSKWLSDPDDSNVQQYIGFYGQEITSTDPSDSPPSLETRVPKSIANPLVYITAAEGVTVTTTGETASAQLGEVLYKDTEISSAQSKNLIVVGGSCINSVAANLLGEPACSADFTTKTGIGSGQFLIQSFGDAYTTGKIALLVAGYEAADTVNAATYLRTKTVDTTAGNKYKGTSSTSAELVVE